jgi:hypothetical protein
VSVCIVAGIVGGCVTLLSVTWCIHPDQLMMMPMIVVMVVSVPVM